MNSPASYASAVIAGVLLGGIFFGGLWWTVRRGAGSTTPAWLFLASQLLRTAVAVCGFYVVSHGDWRKLLGCLVGFLISRGIALRLTRPPPSDRQLRTASVKS